MKGLFILIKLYSQNKTYHHITDLGVASSGGEFARLEKFGLIEQQDNNDSSKKNSGFWKPTKNGIMFAKGDISIPESIQLYNNKVFGFSKRKVFIGDVIGNKFNYRELMR